MKSFNGKTLCLTAIFGAVCLLLGGCLTVEEYQAEAVERARVFLLENAKDLSPEEVSYVKFNDPILLYSEIFGRSTMLAQDLKQICVAWPMSEKNDFYMVYGASTSLMVDWKPLRIFRKNFTKISHPLVAATGTARTYMNDALLQDFSAAQINQIRFLYPTVIRTNFVLNPDPECKLTEEEAAKEAEKLKKETQFSLVWFPPGHDPIVFCGTGREDLEGWSINFAGTMSSDVLRAHTLEVVKRQEQDTSNFLSREEIRKLDERDKEAAKARKAEEERLLQQTVQKHLQSISPTSR